MLHATQLYFGDVMQRQLRHGRRLGSDSSLSLPAIIGIGVAGLILLGVLYTYVRRSQLESRRKQVQKRMDHALFEGNLNNPGLQEQLMPLPHHNPTTQQLNTMPSQTVPVEHVVGSTDSDDFIIMGAASKGHQPQKETSEFPKMQKAAAIMHKTKVKEPSYSKPGTHFHEYE